MQPRQLMKLLMQEQRAVPSGRRGTFKDLGLRAPLHSQLAGTPSMATVMELARDQFPSPHPNRPVDTPSHLKALP